MTTTQNIDGAFAVGIRPEGRDLRRVARWALALTCSLGFVAATHADRVSHSAGLGESRVTTGEIKLVDAKDGDPMLPVKINNTWGLMNAQGDLIALARFDWTDRDYDGRARAVVNGKTGFIRHNGDWLIPPRYIYADRFEDGIAVVSDGERTTFITKAGRPLTSLTFDAALRFREGMAAVMSNGKVGFVNKAGDIAVPLQFATARSFHDGLAAVQGKVRGDSPGRWGYIDKRGELQHQFGEDVLALGDFEDGMARVRVKTQQGNQWGYISRAFRPAIAPRYEQARDFTDGFAAVRVDGKWGFIDKRGEFVIKPQFDEADDFEDGVVRVGIDGKRGMVTKAGRIAIELIYDDARPPQEGLVRVSMDDMFGYVGKTGSVVFDPRLSRRGIRLATSRELASVLASPDDDLVANRRVRPPAERASEPEPYPADYLYEEVLPSQN